MCFVVSIHVGPRCAGPSASAAPVAPSPSPTWTCGASKGLLRDFSPWFSVFFPLFSSIFDLFAFTSRPLCRKKKRLKTELFLHAMHSAMALAVQHGALLLGAQRLAPRSCLFERENVFFTSKSSSKWYKGACYAIEIESKRLYLLEE